MENTPDLITRWNKDLRLVFANAAFETRTGVPNKSLLGKTSSEMGQPDEITLPYAASLQKAFDTGETVEHFNYFPSPGGNVHFYYRITPEKDTAGRIETVLAIARDITAIKKAGEDIKQKQELLQATMDGSMDMIQVFQAVRDEKGNIIDFVWILNNYASEKFYGTVIGQSLLTVNPGVAEAGIFEAFRQVVETGEPNVAERHYVYKQFDGWFYQSAVRLNDGLVTTTVDITHRKLAEQEIRSGREFLQSIIDNSLDLIQVFTAVRDEKGAIVDFTWFINNRRAVGQNGEVIGKSLLKTNPGVISSGIFDRMIQVTETGEPHEQEQYYPHEQINGSWFYLAIVKHGDGAIMTTREITSQKKSEQELLQLKDDMAQQATDRYLQLFNSIDDAFCVIKMIFDDSGKPVDFLYIETNPAFVKHATRPMLGQRIKEIVPDFEQFWLDQYGHVAKTGEVARLENIVHGLDDQWFQTSAFRYGEEDNNEVAVLFRNVTDRKREEKRQNFLFKLNDALRQSVDTKMIASTVTHLLGEELGADRVLYAEYVQINNEGFWSIENAYHLPGFPLADGLYPLSSFGNDFLRILEGHTTVVNDVLNDAGMEAEVKDKLKDRSIAAYIVLPLMKENEFVAFLGVHHAVARQWKQEELGLLRETADRTLVAVGRARAEQSLRENRERLRVTMENAEDYAIITLDTQGRILQWSKGATLSFGYSEPEAAGQSFDIIFTPEDRQANIPARELENALKQGVVPDERWHIRKDGSKFFSSGVTRPIYNPQLAGFVKVTRDVTEQRLLEDQKDEFIAIASHELKTPVTSINLLSQYLREQSDNNEILDADLVQRLDKQVNRLTQLIRDLLDTTKIAEGKLSLNQELFDMGKFIGKQIEDLKTISSGYSFSVDVQSPLSVYADKDRLGQVLTNLISNAMKYSETGTTIFISSVQIPEGIRISIKDQGMGIPEDMQSRVFDRFFRVSGEQMKGRSGMGLGLYISAGIIQHHGGSISVESRMGEGSTFSFIIPERR